MHRLLEDINDFPLQYLWAPARQRARVAVPRRASTKKPVREAVARLLETTETAIVYFKDGTRHVTTAKPSELRRQLNDELVALGKGSRGDAVRAGAVIFYVDDATQKVQYALAADQKSVAPLRSAVAAYADVPDEYTLDIRGL